jgi:hypothetical protein
LGLKTNHLATLDRIAAANLWPQFHKLFSEICLTGVNVMITIFGVFRQFLAKNYSFLLKTIVKINFFVKNSIDLVIW